MIKRLYVDNFRSLVDFEWCPTEEELVVGYNGSGKTSALDAIGFLQAWISGWDVILDWLDGNDLTAWNQSHEAVFRLELEIEGVEYKYAVSLEYNSVEKTFSVSSELLETGGVPTIVRVGAGVTLVSEDQESKTQYFVPGLQSAIYALVTGPDAARVQTFLEALRRMIVVRPTPPRIEDESSGPKVATGAWFENFIGWCQRQAGLSRFTKTFDELLKSVWEDYAGFRFDPMGRGRVVFSVAFQKPELDNKEVYLDFGQLSEGERMLCVLYALAAYQQVVPPTTLIVDEPDNFLALAELQPWLLDVLDDRPPGGQVILVSHNARIIDTMGSKQCVFFYRDDHLSGTRVKKIALEEDDLSLSELLARGWID